MLWLRSTLSLIFSISYVSLSNGSCQEKTKVMLTTLLAILRYSPGLWTLGRILNILLKSTVLILGGKDEGLFRNGFVLSPFSLF